MLSAQPAAGFAFSCRNAVSRSYNSGPSKHARTMMSTNKAIPLEEPQADSAPRDPDSCQNSQQHRNALGSNISRCNSATSLQEAKRNDASHHRASDGSKNRSIVINPSTPPTAGPSNGFREAHRVLLGSALRSTAASLGILCLACISAFLACRRLPMRALCGTVAWRIP